ncbi:YeiH family protein [Paenibacillus lactis]|uniref:YeiH family protein n=1 Tax=Paenibacillus lactis TaxID=228574 RepID=UPI001B15AA9B|nr:putative sulfate exporter family transporter [Paenibacillus lactis]GIO92988.1 membrane protein [Paenibacillus lactis]
MAEPAHSHSQAAKTGPAAAPKTPSMTAVIGGIAFTLAIALIGLALANLPGLRYLGQLAWAILIAAVYRQIRGYPEAVRPGIQFTAKRLLRLAIILYGLKLNIGIVWQQGLGLMLRDVISVVFAIAVTLLIAKRLKADMSLSLLLGIGTGVCGAAAIAAVSPIVQAKEKDTALGAGMIAFVGTIAAILYTLIQPLLPLSDAQFGIWSGVSLHEIAHVALAGASAGEEALTLALLAKLGRVFLLLPLSVVLVLWMKRTHPNESKARPEFPWFLIGFMAASMLGSWEYTGQPIIPLPLKDALSQIASFLLAMAMVGLGLNVHVKDLRRAWRPLLAMAIATILLVLLTYMLV